jgi:hypothetical protein
MSKHYLEIGEHGYFGDFYQCDAVDEGCSFRADNLAIATKIAFNSWLHGFDNLYRECRLSKIIDGSFTVSIHEDGGDWYDETHTVSYYGPGDMFTIEYAHRNGDDWYKQKYSELESLCAAGHPGLRVSKRSGMVMFELSFPHYRADGEWWSGENTYLATNRALAEEQLEYAFAGQAERKQICERNYNAMRNRMEVVND